MGKCEFECKKLNENGLDREDASAYFYWEKIE